MRTGRPKEHGGCVNGVWTSLYSKWMGMRSRCHNKKDRSYDNYGARGIAVCRAWKNSFASFRDWANTNGYKPGLFLDRQDNNKGYSPSNCRWVTVRESVKNRRCAVRLPSGESIPEAAERVGITRSAMRNRIFKTKIPLLDAIELPKTNNGFDRIRLHRKYN